MDVFVARQPIFDKDMKVAAYELLYRDGLKSSFEGNLQGDIATAILLINSFLNLGIDKLTEDYTAFINFDKRLIEADIPLLLDKQKVVVEILENVIPDKNLLKKIEDLKEKGYVIALDDFCITYPYYDLVEAADILKVDFLLNTKKEVGDIARRWRKSGKKLLAEKVENHEMFLLGKELGFDYFQGYFFSKPMVIKGKGIHPNKIQYLRVFDELNHSEPSYDRIAEIIEFDLEMTYKLLKLVNNRLTLISEIRTVKHALAMLGIKEIQRWILLLMVHSIEENKPSEIIKVSLFRSKLGELLAQHSNLQKRKDEIILLGLLSVIDGVLEQPMEEIVKHLPIHHEVKQALMGKTSVLQDMYQLIVHYEDASWEEVDFYAKKNEIDVMMLPALYFEAIQWTDETVVILSQIQKVEKEV